MGTSTKMDLTLWSSHGFDEDTGSFSQYAGPLKVKGVGSRN
ncbi:hypothetical protein [Streptomyces sp. NPDC056663]